MAVISEVGPNYYCYPLSFIFIVILPHLHDSRFRLQKGQLLAVDTVHPHKGPNEWSVRGFLQRFSLEERQICP